MAVSRWEERDAAGFGARVRPSQCRGWGHCRKACKFGAAEVQRVYGLCIKPALTWQVCCVGTENAADTARARAPTNTVARPCGALDSRCRMAPSLWLCMGRPRRPAGGYSPLIAHAHAHAAGRAAAAAAGAHAGPVAHAGAGRLPGPAPRPPRPRPPSRPPRRPERCPVRGWPTTVGPPVR